MKTRNPILILSNLPINCSYIDFQILNESLGSAHTSPRQAEKHSGLNEVIKMEKIIEDVLFPIPYLRRAVQ